MLRLFVPEIFFFLFVMYKCRCIITARLQTEESACSVLVHLTNMYRVLISHPELGDLLVSPTYTNVSARDPQLVYTRGGIHTRASALGCSV